MRNIVQLVIVGLIVILLGSIGIAFVSKVRLAVYSTQCANNIKQLNLTFADYYACNGVFPCGTVKNPDLDPDQRLSWLVSIWPYIQAGPQLRLDAQKSWNSPDNYPPFCDDLRKGSYFEPAHPVGCCPLFVCPYDRAQPKPEEAFVVHYIGVAGLGADAASLPKGAPGVGFFGYDRVLVEDDIADGLAYTITIMETLHDVGPWTAGGPYTVRGLTDPSKMPYLGDNGQWSSRHERIVAGFADCSVRFINKDVAPIVLEALATIADGEEVALP